MSEDPYVDHGLGSNSAVNAEHPEWTPYLQPPISSHAAGWRPLPWLWATASTPTPTGAQQSGELIESNDELTANNDMACLPLAHLALSGST